MPSSVTSSSSHSHHSHSSSSSSEKFTCIVCEWSDGRRRDKLYTRPELYEHFRSPKHVFSWQRWIYYCQEQELGGDYIADWLRQRQLWQLHRTAMANPIR